MNPPNVDGVAADADFLAARRRTLAAHPTQIGIDYVTVEPASGATRRRVALHFIAAAPGHEGKHDALDGVTTAQVRALARDPEGELEVLAVTRPAGQARLDLDLGAGDNDPAVLDCGRCEVRLSSVDHLDPFFAKITLSLVVESPLDLDCDPRAPAAPPLVASRPDINYLARDFPTFRQLMLERLATLVPEWAERNPADGMVAVIEALAQAADKLSYHQDAVSTEAYLDTARRRVSVRRHARLLDYPMHEGANARVWTRLEVIDTEPPPDGPGPVNLPAGSRFFTRVPGQPARIDPGAGQEREARAAGAFVFSTLHDAALPREHGAIEIYAWGAEAATLERGATCASLVGDLPHLQPGDVLILEQTAGALSGLPEDADPELRHAVRLARVTGGLEDPLGGALASPPSGAPVALTEVEWLAGDALPFDLPLARPGLAPPGMASLALARGNVVLAEHGEAAAAEDLEVPGASPSGLLPRFRPRLGRRGLTHRVPYDDAVARLAPARDALVQDPRQAAPAIELADASGAWRLRRDLLASGRFDRDFVVEMENDGGARLRFGDGDSGRKPLPGTTLAALYRVGIGNAGNIGPDSLAHVLLAEPRVLGVTNPLAGSGGTEPESLEQVRLSAPLAFCQAQLCLSDPEIAELTLSHPAVRLAATSLRWTGSWSTRVVGVELDGGRWPDATIIAELEDLLEGVRQAGYELEIAPLDFVGLDIALSVTAAAGAVPAAVEQALLETFSDGELADGRRGFFDPRGLELGQPVYLSEIVSTALGAPGVAAIDFGTTPPSPNRFRRFGQPPRGEIEAGRIRLHRLEIPRVENDPRRPERGRISFIVEGGLS